MYIKHPSRDIEMSINIYPSHDPAASSFPRAKTLHVASPTFPVPFRKLDTQTTGAMRLPKGGEMKTED